MKNILVFTFGYLADLIIGDPYFIYHPVTLIANFVNLTKKIIRRFLPKNKLCEQIGGGVVVLLTMSVTLAATWILIKTLYSFSFWLGFIFESFLCGQMLATKCLKDESMKVYEAFNSGIEKARIALSKIVGRDTEKLDSKDIIKAAVETIAENTSDGVVAPMIFLAIGGVPIGILYKAINTMDSIMGYKNEEYMYFGTFAAKLDDIFNFLPSRITALQIILSSYFLKLDSKNAFKMFLRDRNKHESPNSGQTEAAIAGALDIALGGDSYYFGTLHKKAKFGDSLREVNKNDIVTANKVLYLTSILTFAVLLSIKVFVFLNYM